ncbi:MAG: hypothetical protein K9M54_07520 [Kiritimatiellales bacterium]|nr:hypothetical protein [Kiritimatiellales bacterium]MCF7863971.1 hypothetical protein [Kiritimatiellales bacterium]
MGEKKKLFFSRHAKSSAMVVSLAIHALLIVVALSFVAVTVIKKEDQRFEAKQINRPKMAMKKLQVPVKMKPKRPKPKLRKRITVKTRTDRNTPDIKMPDISGIKGGMGSVGDGGIGGAAGIGFTMPEINIFGVKGRGEKIFIILDSTPFMMLDEIGGIPAYTIIKEELVKILGRLSPTVLFNIAVYDRGHSFVLFPQMVSATSANVAKVDAWLKPLNAVRTKMGDKDYGVKTLGSGSQQITENFAMDPLQNVRQWNQPACLAMKERADAVFLLTEGWGELFHNVAERKPWSPEKLQRWQEIRDRAQRKLDEENADRRSKGQPPRVIPGPYALVEAYFPGTENPPQPERHWYTPREVVDVLEGTRKKWRPKNPLTSGLDKKKNDPFSINVIHFVRADTGANANDEARLRQLTSLCGGDYRTIAGMDAIKSSVSSE